MKILPSFCQVVPKLMRLFLLLN